MMAKSKSCIKVWTYVLGTNVLDLSTCILQIYDSKTNIQKVQKALAISLQKIKTFLVVLVHAYQFLIHILFVLLKVSIPELAPLDVRDRNVALPPPNQLSGSEHPITRSRERYVAQDRFHASSEPHKSPLCVYHDINNWKQACSIKTSQQESENHRKNQLRLRSSTQQSFPVHFTYNFLMDFYQNEKVVQQQREELIAMGKALGETERDDIYKRFVFA